MYHTIRVLHAYNKKFCSVPFITSIFFTGNVVLGLIHTSCRRDFLWESVPYLAFYYCCTFLPSLCGSVFFRIFIGQGTNNTGAVAMVDCWFTWTDQQNAYSTAVRHCHHHSQLRRGKVIPRREKYSLATNHLLPPRPVLACTSSSQGQQRSSTEHHQTANTLACLADHQSRRGAKQ